MTPAVTLLEALRARGVELIAVGDRLRYRPATALTEVDRETIRQHKAELLQLLGSGPREDSPSPQPPDSSDALVSWLAAMPLDRFAREGHPLEVRIPWLDVTFWFVPGAAAAEALASEGISRGRIWTAKELIDLLALPGWLPGQIQTIALAKLEFDGTLLRVGSP